MPSASRRWAIAAPAVHRRSSATGRRPPLETQKTLNAEILVIPMIETPQAVENADKIAAIEGIDALLIGTNDLALEMGIAGQVGHERVQAAYRKVADACRAPQEGAGHGRRLRPGGGQPLHRHGRPPDPRAAATTICCWTPPRAAPSSCAGSRSRRKAEKGATPSTADVRRRRRRIRSRRWRGRRRSARAARP